MDAADLRHRSAIVEVIVGQAQEDLNGAWRSLLSDPVERAAAGMREVLPAVAEQYGTMAGDRAMFWYEDMRPASAPKYQPRLFAAPKIRDAAGLATWSVTPLFSGLAETAWERLAGTLQQLVAGYDRATIMGNADRDSAAFGWVRRASPDACAFCAYMSVMVTKHTGDMGKFHDNCRCVPVMAFEGQTIPEQVNESDWVRIFDEAADAIEVERRQLPDWDSLRRGERSRKYPEYQITTKNILARARRMAPDMFRDGVRLAA